MALPEQIETIAENALAAVNSHPDLTLWVIGLLLLLHGLFAHYQVRVSQRQRGVASPDGLKVMRYMGIGGGLAVVAGFPLLVVFSESIRTASPGVVLLLVPLSWAYAHVTWKQFGPTA